VAYKGRMKTNKLGAEPPAFICKEFTVRKFLGLLQGNFEFVKVSATTPVHTTQHSGTFS